MKRSLRLCHPPPIRNTEAVPPASMPATAAGTGEHRELSQGVPPAGDAAAWPQSPTGHRLMPSLPGSTGSPWCRKSISPTLPNQKIGLKAGGLFFFLPFFSPFFLFSLKKHTVLSNWVWFSITARGTLCVSFHMHREQRRIWKEINLGFSCNLLAPGLGTL